MRFLSIGLALLLFAGCAATMREMEKSYAQENTRVSPEFDRNHLYTLAVLPASVSTRVERADLDGLYSYAEMACLQTGFFQPVDRTKIEAILKEQQFEASGLVDPSTAAKFGKLAGAEALMFTNVISVKHNDFFTEAEQRDAQLSVRIISATTGKLLYSGQGEGSSFEGPLDALKTAMKAALLGFKQ
jgi:PBP1b-binding outer membrane lipoprotein LpoB